MTKINTEYLLRCIETDPPRNLVSLWRAARLALLDLLGFSVRC